MIGFHLGANDLRQGYGCDLVILPESDSCTPRRHLGYPLGGWSSE